MKYTTPSKPVWFIAAILLVCLTISVLPAQAQRDAPSGASASRDKESKPDPLATLLQQAKIAIDRLDFAGAVATLQKYIAQRPDDAYAHFQLGYAYVGLKRADEAKAEFTRAIAIDPKMAAAHQNLGLVLMDSDPAAAANSFLRAAELQPTESRPRFLAGVSFDRAQKFIEAIEQYRAALAISPKDYDTHFALGRALLRSGDAAGAETEFHEAVTARADSAPAYLGLGDALLAQNKDEAALDAIDGYLKLSPGDRVVRVDRAAVLFEMNRYDDALAELDRASAGSAPSADELKMRGNIYLLQAKWKEAGETLTQAMQLSPQDAELAGWLGHVDVELHQYPAAINILVQVYKQNPQAIGALRDLTNAFYLNENYAEAIGAMDQLAKLETPPPGSWFVRAVCYDKLSHKVEAVEAYQKFLDQDNGEHETEDLESRHRIVALQGELGQNPKK